MERHYDLYTEKEGTETFPDYYGNAGYARAPGFLCFGSNGNAGVSTNEEYLISIGK